MMPHKKGTRQVVLVGFLFGFTQVVPCGAFHRHNGTRVIMFHVTHQIYLQKLSSMI